MAHKDIRLILTNGGIGVLPTDTIYGIVGSALRRATVERIYQLRRRNPEKPMIILIGSTAQLSQFGIKPNVVAKKILEKVWPGKVSVVLTSPKKKFSYLDRGTGALAFRMPKPEWLRSILEATGPLVAPSANIEGKPHSRTIEDAKKYFGDEPDFYFDRGPMNGKPSKLIKIEQDDGGNAQLIILRK